ncbi:hypothetical protein MSG28_015077 [Choristoneura fumiferana]|uniref:Uncharacterized protein n=1 Tax=Choristoneura fumiferana TaxID=7141 RepID=A0ACC0KYR8_CHOFU|nr:hypothetical protein MSG28_015077 [Choristoneura fumiferana]
MAQTGCVGDEAARHELLYVGVDPGRCSRPQPMPQDTRPMRVLRPSIFMIGGQLQRSYRMQDFASPGVIMRERSFIRPQSHHNMHHNQCFSRYQESNTHI